MATLCIEDNSVLTNLPAGLRVTGTTGELLVFPQLTSQSNSILGGVRLSDFPEEGSDDRPSASPGISFFPRGHK